MIKRDEGEARHVKSGERAPPEKKVQGIRGRGLQRLRESRGGRHGVRRTAVGTQAVRARREWLSRAWRPLGLRVSFCVQREPAEEPLGKTNGRTNKKDAFDHFIFQNNQRWQWGESGGWIWFPTSSRGKGRPACVSADERRAEGRLRPPAAYTSYNSPLPCHPPAHTWSLNRILSPMKQSLPSLASCLPTGLTPRRAVQTFSSRPTKCQTMSPKNTGNNMSDTIPLCWGGYYDTDRLVTTRRGTVGYLFWGADRVQVMSGISAMMRRLDLDEEADIVYLFEFQENICSGFVLLSWGFVMQ